MSLAGEAPAWATLLADELCPCCGDRAGCTLRDGGDYVRCHSVVSALPMLGGGWLHPLVAGAFVPKPTEGDSR